MKAYKLTDHNGQTRNETQWGEGVTHSATGTGPGLCSAGWIHFYTDPLIAVFMNPIDAEFYSPQLWECETAGEHLFEPLKAGCKTLTTIRKLDLPIISNTQRVAFAILCAKQVFKASTWNNWADNWLSGKDRTRAAYAAAYDAAAAARADAAYDAADAAYDAADAAYDAAAAASARAAAADAADAARAAARAAYYATNNPIDFPALARQALTYEH